MTDWTLDRTPWGISAYAEHVMHHGAVGDGVADDTAAILEAIAALGTRGGIVLFPPGKFRFTSQILIETTATLQGAGYGASSGEDDPTVLFKDGSFDGIKIAAEAAGVKNLVVDGETGNGHDGIYIAAGGRNLIEDVLVTNQGGTGVKIGPKPGDEEGNCNLWRIRTLILVGNGAHGLFISSEIGNWNCNTGLCSGIDVRSNGGDGIRLGNTIDNVFVGTHVATCVGSGVRITTGKGQVFLNPYIELNHTGSDLYDNEIVLDADSAENFIQGCRQGIYGDDYDDYGTNNYVLGRINKSSRWHHYGKMNFTDLGISNPNVSGTWIFEQLSSKDLSIHYDAGTTPIDVAFTHDQGGKVRLRADYLRLGRDSGPSISGCEPGIGTRFPGEIAAGATQDLSTFGVTGVEVGDRVVAVPDTDIGTSFVWNAFVSAADTVTVRIANITTAAATPASAMWKIDVWKWYWP